MQGDSSPQSTTPGSEPAPLVQTLSLEDEVKNLEILARQNGMSAHRILEMRRQGKNHAQLLLRKTELQTWLDAN